MANVIRIKKRAGTGSAGAPTSLAPSELAFNEVSSDRTLYYGLGDAGNGSSDSVIAIGGSGAFTTLSTAQTISGDKTFTGTVNLSGATLSGNTTFSNNLTVTGDLTVSGTTTTVNSTTVTVDDKNIELGSVDSPSESTANGGGLTLKGGSDHTILYTSSGSTWDFSEHVNLASGKSFKIAGTDVLSATALGDAVVSSALTSVGTISSGTWNAGVISPTYGGTGQDASSASNGQLLIGNGSGLSLATLTAGSNVTITNSSGGITIAASGGTSISAGDGIDVSGSTVSVDLYANGGIIFQGEDKELRVDLSASALDGTLAVSDGGTGATSASAARTALGLAIGSDVQAYNANLATLSLLGEGVDTAIAALSSTEVAALDGSTSATSTTLASSDRFIVNDAGSVVQVALSDLVTFLADGGTSSFVIDGGTF